MAEVALTFLMENLKDLLLYKVNLIADAKSELQQLQDELKILKGFLQEAPTKLKKEETFRVFEKQIRQVVHEAEDTIDVCVAQMVVEKEKNIVKRNFNSKRLSLAKQVKAIRLEKIAPKFDKAKMDFANLQIGDGSEIGGEEKLGKTNKVPSVREDNIVGFEEEVEDLVKDLMNKESDELDVISITGMPGLGKTTLLWKLYRDSRIQFKFSTVIWVYASQKLNRKDVYLTILKKFTQEDMSRKNEYELVQIVRKHLEKIKFLLFVDDVWTVEAWNAIQAVLTKSNKMGKVVITSRNEIVAWHANRDREPCRLRFLDQNESWDLLQLEVFGKLGECPSELQALGERIANQCDGLPLAIMVIGGILVDKFSMTGAVKNEWERVSASVSTYIKDDDKEKHMENIISFSYNNLPYDLRECFLYLGVFPEDFEIPAWKLTCLWIAEGFIEKKKGKSLEETAEDNLKDLINRNLVMVDRLNPRGEVKTCRVHDMIREFCKTEGAIERQNLFQEIRKSKEGVFEPPVLEIEKHRRICIHSHLVDFLTKNPKGPSVRSFLCFLKEAIHLPAEHNRSIPTAFNLLRVLEAKSIRFTRFPAKLNQLHYLRYLTLSGDNLKVLPDAISKLRTIQTLTVDTMERSIKVEADILNMTHLRHIKTKSSMVLTKKGGKVGDAGENLQTLTKLSTESCTKDVFDRAKNIKTLGIRGDLNTLLKTRCLEELRRLEKLKLRYDLYPNAEIDNPLTRLPDPDTFPPNLKILTLSATFLDWKHMITLGKIYTLEVLKLKEKAFVGDTWAAIGGGFYCLEILHIVGKDLEYWTATSDSFPRLRCLMLKNCDKLQEIPFEIERSLQLLELERVNKTVVASAKKIEEAKKHLQGHRRPSRGGFKLVVGPGEQ